MQRHSSSRINAAIAPARPPAGPGHWLCLPRCRTPRQPLPRLLVLRAGLVVFFTLLQTGCHIQPDQITARQRQNRIHTDFNHMFAHQEPLRHPLSLSEAIARGLKYNLDIRLKKMENILSQKDFRVAQHDLLPEMLGSLGYLTRSNNNVTTEGLNSQASKRFTNDLQFSWSALDFGISYMTAHQKADFYLLSRERRQKMAENVVRDIRYAYWRAVAADALKWHLAPMMKKVHRALSKAKYIETHQLKNSTDALEYQKSLWETLQQLVTLEKDLNKAKTELGAMINIRPGTRFRLVHEPPHSNPLPKGFPLDIDLLERIALMDRPELREEDYRKRIAIQTIRKARIAMLPNLNIEGGINFDSNQFLLNNTWANAGVRLSVDLLNLIHAPARVQKARWDKFVADTRRLALSMAILTQVDVAYLRYFQTAKTLSVAEKLRAVNQRLYQQAKREAHAAKIDELTLIKRELNALIADLRYRLSYAEWENAAGQLLSAIGYNPLGRVDPNQTIRELKHIIHFSLDHIPIPRADLVHFEHGHRHHRQLSDERYRLPYHGRITHAIR